MTNLVRIEQIEINGIKNILHGCINFNEYQNIKKGIFDFNSVLGLYGQNGSGKTTVLEVSSILRNLLLGEMLPIDINKIINNEKNKANISYTFFIQYEDKRKLVTYDFEIALHSVDETQSNEYDITYEKLTSKDYDEENKKFKKQIILFESVNNSIILKKLLDKFTVEQRVELRVAKEIEKGTSLLFNKRNRRVITECLLNNKDKDELIYIMNLLVQFADRNLIIIENDYIGSVKLLPSSFMALNIHLEKANVYFAGTMPMNIFEPNIITTRLFEQIQIVMEQIDIVLSAVVPGLNIKIVNAKNELTEKGEEGVRFEVASLRENKYIPLKYESEGIKRIISITSALIAAYNNPSICLMIDEFDSGIYEYLLGEILQVMDESAKGQFVFTSHNLHALEKLSYKSILFTTTNPNERFIRLGGVKPNNNVRDFYFTSILLGGQSEELYNESKGYKIKKALRKAGTLYE